MRLIRSVRQPLLIYYFTLNRVSVLPVMPCPLYLTDYIFLFCFVICYFFLLKCLFFNIHAKACCLKVTEWAVVELASEII